ncbi:signal peptide peptidase SppA [candidate division WOR-3 bacterium]|nr:signal peptide peptidase SppA [candidate division WOR-3 bacterium]
MNRKSTIVLIIVGVASGLVMLVLFLSVLAAQGGDGASAVPGWRRGLGYVEIEGAIVDATETVRQLQWLERQPQVKGILIRIDSPGGIVTPSHEIYSEVARISDEGKPVVVSMGTIAASGAYYVAAPADLIVASPQTLTGSIGVIMEFPVVKGLMDKLGVKVEVVKSRDQKDVGSPFREMTEKDRASLQSVVTDAYEQFVEIVSSRRELPEDSVRAIADGRIMTGRQALALGLVDTLGTFEDAKRIAADLCGIEGEPRLIRPTRRMGFLFRQLLEGTTENLLGGLKFPRLRYVYY